MRDALHKRELEPKHFQQGLFQTNSGNKLNLSHKYSHGRAIKQGSRRSKVKVHCFPETWAAVCQFSTWYQKAKCELAPSQIGLFFWGANLVLAWELAPIRSNECSFGTVSAQTISLSILRPILPNHLPELWSQSELRLLLGHAILPTQRPARTQPYDIFLYSKDMCWFNKAWTYCYPEIYHLLFVYLIMFTQDTW